MTGHTSRADTTRVVVIGAGYAGLMTTNRFLGSLTDAEQQRMVLTVVNPLDVFVERIRLHELAAGSRGSVTSPLADLLHPSAHLIVGDARLIDTATKTVHVSTATDQLSLPYDYVVYAVGSLTAAPIPGASQYAFPIGDYDGAVRAARAINAAGATPRLVVVGGGLTGVETASEMAERYPGAEVTLYCAGPLLPGARPAARATVATYLKRLGVSIHVDTAVTTVDRGRLRLQGGQVYSFDHCLLAASFTVPDLADRSGLAVGRDGRLRVDEHLRCIDAPTVIGAGDAIVMAHAAHLRMGCAVALPLGSCAARTLLATIRGTIPPVASIGFVVQCISLGRKHGYIQVLRPDDTPRALHVEGRVGAWIKERICTMTLDAPVKEITKPGAYTWPKGPTGDR